MKIIGEEEEKEFIKFLFEAAFDPEGFDLSYNDPPTGGPRTKIQVASQKRMGADSRDREMTRRQLIALYLAITTTILMICLPTIADVLYITAFSSWLAASQ